MYTSLYITATVTNTVSGQVQQLFKRSEGKAVTVFPSGSCWCQVNRTNKMGCTLTSVRSSLFHLVQLYALRGTLQRFPINILKKKRVIWSETCTC
jgi:hypothetical protein